MRIAEPDWRNPSIGYQRVVQGFSPRTQWNVECMAEMMMGAGFFVRGIEFHDAYGQFRISARDLMREATPARSRLRDARGKDPDTMYSSLVIDGYKVVAGLSPAYEGWFPKFLAVGDSHTRFLAGKDDTENGEDIPHAKRYAGFAAHFDALHLGPGLAYNLDRAGSKTKIFERVNALIDAGTISGKTTTVFSFGEIDCRSHVVPQSQRQGKSIELVVADICSRYKRFLEHVINRGMKPAVWGPIASTLNQNYGDPDAPANGTLEERNHAITVFNDMMRDVCGALRVPFLGIARGLMKDFQTTSEFYCDDIHASQRARRFLWALMPDGKMIEPPPAPVERVTSWRQPDVSLCDLQLFKPNGGWTWFQDERVVAIGRQLLIGSAAGKTRSGAEAGDIELTVMNVESRTAHTVKLRERFQADDHDAPSILELPSGRVVAAYQSHPAAGIEGTNLMRWRVSKDSEDLKDWEDECSVDVGGPVSYSHLIHLPGENGRIYSFFRGPDSRPHYLVSDDGGESFVNAGKLLSWDFDRNDPRYSGRDGYRPYLKYIAGSEDTIHLIASEDHPRAWPNGIYHAKLCRGRILSSSGLDIGPMGCGLDAPVRVDQLTCVFRGDEDHIAWPMDIHVDKHGHPVILFSVRKGDRERRRMPACGGSDHRYYYARCDGSCWKVFELCYGGSALYQDEEDFTGLAAVDPNEPSVVFVSTNSDPITGEPLINERDKVRRFEIFRGVSADEGATWVWAALTAQSERDNIRPVVPIWPGSRRAVLWMRGNYTTFTNFDTDIVGFIEPR
jgi:hypothetical protein